MTLQGGQVVEELRLLALLLLLQLRDLAGLARNRLDDRDRLRLCRQALAAEVAPGVMALRGGLEASLH